MGSAESPLFMRVFEFREDHKNLFKEVHCGKKSDLSKYDKQIEVHIKDKSQGNFIKKRKKLKRR